MNEVQINEEQKNKIKEAIENGNLQLLIQNLPQDSVNLRIEYDPLLVIAAEAGQVEIVKYLLDQGANVNLVSKGSRSTPLMVAIEKDHNDIAQILIDRGADLTLLDFEDESALHVAAGHDNVAMIELLLEKGGNIDIAHPFTPLMTAACYSKPLALECLLKHGASYNNLFDGYNNSLSKAIKISVENNYDGAQETYEAFLKFLGDHNMDVY